MLQLRAPAKLNLGLRILDRRADGYHEIETLLVPLCLFDRLCIRAGGAPGVRLVVEGAQLPTDGRNLVVRAAELACQATGLTLALDIRLRKSIPVAAGLGGGSSDAAATLIGVERLAAHSLEDAARRVLALRLGADVPFFLDPRPALSRGIGEQLEPVHPFPEMWWLLVAFPFGVSTAAAYRSASSELTLPRQGSSIAALLGPSGVKASPINDLEAVATRRHPEIAEARRELEEARALVTGMTGSGPTVFGSFPDREAAERAARVVKLPARASSRVVRSPSSGSDDWGWGVAKR